jgi:hypothetical protein
MSLNDQHAKVEEITSQTTSAYHWVGTISYADRTCDADAYLGVCAGILVVTAG